MLFTAAACIAHPDAPPTACAVHSHSQPAYCHPQRPVSRPRRDTKRSHSTHRTPASSAAQRSPHLGHQQRLVQVSVPLVLRQPVDGPLYAAVAREVQRSRGPATDANYLSYQYLCDTLHSGAQRQLPWGSHAGCLHQQDTAHNRQLGHCTSPSQTCAARSAAPPLSSGYLSAAAMLHTCWAGTPSPPAASGALPTPRAATARTARRAQQAQSL